MTFNKPKVNHLLFIPFLLACISNLIVCWFSNSQINSNFPYIDFLEESLIIIVAVVAEEVLFRAVIYGELSLKYQRFLAIIISSGIFGAMHLLNINSIASIPYCLIQSVYTFGLGLILGLVYSFSKNFVYPVVLHFLFNLLNNSLAPTLYELNWNLTFYLVNIGISVLLILYGIGVYFILRKTEGDYAS